MQFNAINRLIFKFSRSNLKIASVACFIGLGILIMASSDPATPKTCTCGTLIGIEFGPDVPGDNKLVTGQTQADCFAWWEFVALNWPVDPNDGFGTPGNTDLVQWETYMTREVLLSKDGSPPPAWGQTSVKKVLMHHTKFNSTSVEVLDETGQAFPQDKPNWLGAQNHTNLWYEVLVNKDEYEYFVDNAFYNADSQYVFVTAGNVIDLPEGSDLQTGALELKASWMEVPNPDDEKWNRYKLSNAELIDPVTNRSRQSVVALIGLHILHKTESQPTWFWATFEHVDNVPNATSNPSASYNLYSSECKTQEVNVPGNCGKNTNQQDSTYTIECITNQIASYYLCDNAGPVPIQVNRENPIDVDAIAVNAQLQEYIAENFPNSVWSNYELVNMIWSTTPQNVQSNLTPQGLKSMQPSIPVANTASETFIQNVTCFGCHQSAPIAPTASSPDNSKWASDFSFVFEFAGYKGKE